MAITLLGKPTNNNNPAYNPLVYYFDSTNKTQPGFRYIARVLTPSNQLLFEKTILPDFDAGKCILNINREMSDFVSHTINLNPANVVGYNAAESYTRFKLDIGEEYFVSWNFSDFEFIGTLPQYNPNNLPNATALATTNTGNVPPYLPGDFINVTFTTTNPAKPQLQGVQEVLAVVARPGGGWHVVLNIGWVGSGPSQGGSTVYADNRKTRFTGLYTAINNECVFNGALSPADFLTYNMTDFLMSSTTANKKILSQMYSGYRVRRDNFVAINWMTNDVSTNIPTQMEFTSDDGTVTRINVNANTAQWIKQINVGPSRTNFGTVISGTGPLIKPDTKWYEFRFRNAAGTYVSETYRINIDDGCAPHENIEMLFLDKLGSFLPWNFTFRNLESHNIQRQDYTKYLGGLRNGKYEYDLTDGGSEIYDSSFDRTFTLKTGYLNTTESKFFQNVIHSPVTYIKIDGQFQRCKITTNTVELKKEKWYELKRYEIQVVLSNSNKINI